MPFKLLTLTSCTESKKIVLQPEREELPLGLSADGQFQSPGILNLWEHKAVLSVAQQITYLHILALGLYQLSLDKKKKQNLNPGLLIKFTFRAKQFRFSTARFGRLKIINK